MTSNDDPPSEGRSNSGELDARVLGRILAGQNIFFILPTGKSIAEFYARSMRTLPGVGSCRLCIGNSFSQEGTFDSNACDECKIGRDSIGKEEITTIPKGLTCKLDGLPNCYTYALETLDHRFGFLVFSVEQWTLFEPCKPFVGNFVNFVALSLENRLQRAGLQKAQDELEQRVAERTSELRTVNSC